MLLSDLDCVENSQGISVNNQATPMPDGLATAGGEACAAPALVPAGWLVQGPTRTDAPT